MKHHHHSGAERHHGPHPAEGHPDHPEFRHRPDDGGRPHRHGRGRRLFDYGELRLLLLAMIAERPSHGYELIKAIEERFGGAYSPSPGVIYPTLAWLEDMGYVTIAPDGGRKLCRIADEGGRFLEANRAAAEDLLARTAGADGRPPAPVIRAMENLRLALRLRLRRGPVDEAALETIAAALDAAARTVEKS